MLDVIDWTLQKCGLSLAKALKTKRYATLLKKESAISAIPDDSLEGIALKTGHMTMGRLLNCLPEKQAVEKAQSLSHANSYSPEERALIRFCGEAIVKSATECLPPEAITIAKRWKSSSAEWQLNAVQELYTMFRSERAEAEGELNMDTVMRKMWEKPEKDRNYDQLGFLPGLYGKWHKDTCWANCQGKTQMFTAFAKLAGAPVLVIHPITHARDIMYEARKRVKQIVSEDLRERGLEKGCKLFAESMQASNYEDIKEDYFHVGVALQLKDRSWVQLDSHGLCWGKLSQSWNMREVCAVLKKYRDTLPGLTILAHDHGDGKRLIDEHMVIVTDLLSRSRRMEKTIKERVQSIIDFIDVLSESEDFDVILDLDAKEKGRKPFDLSNPSFRKHAAMLFAVGNEENIWNFMALDPGFLDQRIKVWLTAYHATAVNLFINRQTDEGHLIHPVCEFSASSEWSIAISALNSAAWRVGYRRGTTDDFFVRNSFDQTTLFNAASAYGSEIGIAAKETLAALPFLHPLCSRRIGKTTY